MNRLKFSNIILVIAMLVSLMSPLQVFAAPERLPAIRMAGALAWNGYKYIATGDATFTMANPKAKKPTSLTIIKNGRPMTAQVTWDGNSTHMYIPEGVQFLYFNTGNETLTHRIVPQGRTKQLWTETENRNAVCVKPCN
jgi:hypothetical protein